MKDSSQPKKELNPLERAKLMAQARRKFRILFSNLAMQHPPSSTTENSEKSPKVLVR